VVLVQLEKTFIARICMWLGFITADAFAYLAAVVPVQKLWKESRYSVGAVYKLEVRKDLMNREVNGWKKQSDMTKVCNRTVCLSTNWARHCH
jgi:hypothetical protein